MVDLVELKLSHLTFVKMLEGRRSLIMRENCELMTRYLFLSLSLNLASLLATRVEFFRSKSLYAFFVRIIILTVNS